MDAPVPYGHSKCFATSRQYVLLLEFWGLWAIIQARHSPIDFDFMEYARMRFKGYFYLKGLWADDLYKITTE